MLSASEVASAGLTATVTGPTASCGLITAPTSWPTMSVCAGVKVAGPPNENDGAAPATLFTMTTPMAGVGGVVDLDTDRAGAAVDEGDEAVEEAGRVRFAAEPLGGGRTVLERPGEAGGDRRPVNGVGVLVEPGDRRWRGNPQRISDGAWHLGLRDRDDARRRRG